MSTWTEQLDRTVDAHSAQMIEVRRHLHAHPELSGHELQTIAYLRAQIQAAGLEPQVVLDGRGIIVDGPANTETPRIALRADVDALPIQDAKVVAYRSTVPGVMHACGHDAHAAMVLGAMLSVASIQKSGDLPWPVPWRTLFQPAEETCEGAQQMIEAGALANVSCLISTHIDPARPVGFVGMRAGTLTANCSQFRIEIYGRRGHAARPHESLDPIAAAAQLINSIYLFLPRTVDARDPVVVTIGQIAGGETFNVIPEHVHMQGTMRSFDEAVHSAAKDQIRQLARGIAEASGTRIEIQFRDGPPSVHNDPDLTKRIQLQASELLGTDHVQLLRHPSMGGEDFAYYLKTAPGSMFRLGCAASPSGGPALHSDHFDIDEQALSIGAKLLARSLVDLSNPEQSLTRRTAATNCPRSKP